MISAGNQSIGQYLSVHEESFSNPPTNRRLEEAVAGEDDEIQSFITCPSSTPGAISEVGEKMFLAIYKAPNDEHNLNNRRYAAFLKSSTKIRVDISSIPPNKGAAEQYTLSMCFCFVTFNGTCTKGAPLKEEEEFELDQIL
ncbi:hypothetical protein AVEN_214676-1 [Araneus ventricosus]|uniref:Uncharacterized protein n=1 Tax=Araneus ventricosus TaxID=182803 RepID=A0A4Y2K8Y5_ARAVE|nr:hypothetical protein AVEN_214676-1 [Araneus ventricosus]